jgi:hypothetical protein
MGADSLLKDKAFNALAFRDAKALSDIVFDCEDPQVKKALVASGLGTFEHGAMTPNVYGSSTLFEWRLPEAPIISTVQAINALLPQLKGDSKEAIRLRDAASAYKQNFDKIAETPVIQEMLGESGTIARDANLTQSGERLQQWLENNKIALEKLDRRESGLSGRVRRAISQMAKGEIPQDAGALSRASELLPMEAGDTFRQTLAPAAQVEGLEAIARQPQLNLDGVNPLVPSGYGEVRRPSIPVSGDLPVMIDHAARGDVLLNPSTFGPPDPSLDAGFFHYGPPSRAKILAEAANEVVKESGALSAKNVVSVRTKIIDLSSARLLEQEPGIEIGYLKEQVGKVIDSALDASYRVTVHGVSNVGTENAQKVTALLKGDLAKLPPAERFTGMADVVGQLEVKSGSGAAGAFTQLIQDSSATGNSTLSELTGSTLNNNSITTAREPSSNAPLVGTDAAGALEHDAALTARDSAAAVREAAIVGHTLSKAGPAVGSLGAILIAEGMLPASASAGERVKVGAVAGAEALMPGLGTNFGTLKEGSKLDKVFGALESGSGFVGTAGAVAGGTFGGLVGVGAAEFISGVGYATAEVGKDTTYLMGADVSPGIIVQTAKRGFVPGTKEQIGNQISHQLPEQSTNPDIQALIDLNGLVQKQRKVAYSRSNSGDLLPNEPGSGAHPELDRFRSLTDEFNTAVAKVATEQPEILGEIATGKPLKTSPVAEMGSYKGRRQDLTALRSTEIPDPAKDRTLVPDTIAEVAASATSDTAVSSAPTATAMAKKIAAPINKLLTTAI